MLVHCRVHLWMSLVDQTCICQQTRVVQVLVCEYLSGSGKHPHTNIFQLDVPIRWNAVSAGTILRYSMWTASRSHNSTRAKADFLSETASGGVHPVSSEQIKLTHLRYLLVRTPSTGMVISASNHHRDVGGYREYIRSCMPSAPSSTF